MASKKRSCLTLSQVLDDVFASSGSEELGESSNMISEDEGDVIFRRPPGCVAVLTDSESELDGESSRNSSRSASFDQDSGGSELDDVYLCSGDLSDDGSHSSRQSSSPSPPRQSRGQGTGRPRGCGRGEMCKFMTRIISSQFHAIKKNVKKL